MKAIVKTKKEAGIELLDVDPPEIRDTDILVKVAAGSLCGSDLHYYHWLPGSEILRVPLILGHEFSGEVVEIGAAVRNAEVGDRICAPPSMPCGRCPNCRVGRGDICTDRLTGGGFDIVFEATGNRKAIPQALEMIKSGGQVVLIGIHSQLVEFDPTPMVRSRKSIISAYGYTDQQWSRGMSLLASGRLDVESIVTHRLPLARAEEGFHLATKQEAAKVLFIP